MEEIKRGKRDTDRQKERNRVYERREKKGKR